MINLKTHLQIENALCGKVTKLEDGYAEVLLHTTQSMVADEKGLLHGGFLFGAADYAAMCAVNDPFVVLGAASSKFIAPVKVGEAVLSKATVSSGQGKKSVVSVTSLVGNKVVFEGSFTTFVLESHVLD